MSEHRNGRSGRASLIRCVCDFTGAARIQVPTIILFVCRAARLAEVQENMLRPPRRSSYRIQEVLHGIFGGDLPPARGTQVRASLGVLVLLT